MGLILAALLKARSDGVAAQVAVQAQTDMEAARVRIDERLGPLGLLTLLAGCGAGGGGSFCVAAAPIYVAAEDVLTELWPKLGDGGLRKAAYRGG